MVVVAAVAVANFRRTRDGRPTAGARGHTERDTGDKARRMDELVMMDYTWRREIYSRRKREDKTEKKREEKKRKEKRKGLLGSGLCYLHICMYV